VIEGGDDPPDYEYLPEMLRNPKHEEHKEMRERIAPNFDPEAFEIRRGRRGPAAETLTQAGVGTASSRGGAISKGNTPVSPGETAQQLNYCFLEGQADAARQ
jgi:hypothetical protein